MPPWLECMGCCMTLPLIVVWTAARIQQHYSGGSAGFATPRDIRSSGKRKSFRNSESRKEQQEE